MPSHPNRSKLSPSEKSSPKPRLIALARSRFNMTEKDAAELLYCTEKAWRDWENGARRMHPTYWELFLLKVGALRLPFALYRDQPPDLER